MNLMYFIKKTLKPMRNFLTFIIIASLAFGVGLMYDPALSSDMHLLGAGLMVLFALSFAIREQYY